MTNNPPRCPGEHVTPEERAEKMGVHLYGDARSVQPRAISYIAAQIREAINEDRDNLYKHAFENGRQYKLSYWMERLTQVKAEAYEDAAKIADTYDDGSGGVANLIRARANEA